MKKKHVIDIVSLCQTTTLMFCCIVSHAEYSSYQTSLAVLDTLISFIKISPNNYTQILIMKFLRVLLTKEVSSTDVNVLKIDNLSQTLTHGWFFFGYWNEWNEKITSSSSNR